MVYECHRSGSAQSQSSGQRREKSQGVNKLGFFCPARITTTTTANNIAVSYQSAHYGHDDRNFGRLNLFPEERDEIAEQLRNGVTINSILDKIRDSITDVADPKYIITKKDLHNIKRDYALFPGRRDPDDYKSLIKYIGELEAQKDNPVRLFQEPSASGDRRNDFMLVLCNQFQLEMLILRGNAGIVCMDSTHGVTAYGYQLTSIVVIDESGSGVPVAFCLSSGTSSVEWEVFLGAIKESIGHKIHADVIMTDNDPSFYNAWLAVMGPVRHRLLCAWHIDKCWRRNLNKVN